MSQDHSHGIANHVSDPKVFLRTFIALVFLMALTVASNFIQINPWVNNGINLGIALVKASLVVMFFMGVKQATKLTKMFAIAGFVWLTLITITFGDYATRSWEPVPGWDPHDAESHSAMQSDSISPLAKQHAADALAAQSTPEK